MSLNCVIIIPAKNEEENIPKLIEELKRNDIPLEKVVLINSQSTDNTAEIARKMGLRVINQEREGGKAAAIATALENINSRCFVIMDADLEHPAEYVKKALYLLESGNCDYVMGERELLTRSIIYRVGNKILTMIFNMLWRTNFEDVLTGLIGFKVESIGGRYILSKRFCLEVEMLSRALSTGAKICRFKFPQRPRMAGEKKLQIWHGIEILSCILKYKLLFRKR